MAWPPPQIKMKNFSITALCGILLGGCATTSSEYHIATADSDAIRSLEGIYLEVEPLENGPLLVELHPEPWRYLQASSSMASAQYSAPPSPGVSPGQAAAAGVAGGLIGTMIVSSMAKSQAQAQAQQPAAPLLENLAGRGLQRDVREAVVDAMLSSEFSISSGLKYGPHEREGNTELVLEPSIKLTNGLGVLKFNLNAELCSGPKQCLYRNSIEYWTEGTGSADRDFNLGYWQAGELTAFYEALNRGMAYTADYLAQSLAGSLPEPDVAMATHKIAGNGGWVMMRGKLIQNTDQFAVLQDLRGNIKIIEGGLLTD